MGSWCVEIVKEIFIHCTGLVKQNKIKNLFIYFFLQKKSKNSKLNELVLLNRSP